MYNLLKLAEVILIFMQFKYILILTVKLGGVKMANVEHNEDGVSSITADRVATKILIEELQEAFEKRYRDSDGNCKDTHHLIVLYDTLKQLGWETDTELSRDAEDFILTFKKITGEVG